MARIVSACRHCQFYKSEGRRGGMCHQLSVPVQGGWKSCSLAAHPFMPAWNSLPGIVALQEALDLESIASVAHLPAHSSLDDRTEVPAFSPASS